MPCTKPLSNFKATLRQRCFRWPPRSRRDRRPSITAAAHGEAPRPQRPGPAPGAGPRSQPREAPAQAAAPRRGQRAGRPCPLPRKLRTPRRLAYLCQNSSGGRRGERCGGEEEQDFKSLQLLVLSPGSARARSLSLSFLLHSPPPRCSPASRARGAELPPSLPQRRPHLGGERRPLRARAAGAGPQGVLAGRHISGGGPFAAAGFGSGSARCPSVSLRRRPCSPSRSPAWRGVAWRGAARPAGKGLPRVTSGTNRSHAQGRRALRVRGSSIA